MNARYNGAVHAVMEKPTGNALGRVRTVCGHPVYLVDQLCVADGVELTRDQVSCLVCIADEATAKR